MKRSLLTNCHSMTPFTPGSFREFLPWFGTVIAAIEQRLESVEQSVNLYCPRSTLSLKDVLEFGS